MIQLFKKIYVRIKYILIPPKQVFLLEMVLNSNSNISSNNFSLNEAYELRQFNSERDLISYTQLLKETEMGECPLDYWYKHILPDGFFVVVHIPSGTIVGTCFASHHPSERHPFAGNLGWLAVHPNHRGHRIAQLLVEQVVSRLKSVGYKRIYLETHDFRVPAILLYLKTGWIPYLYNEDVTRRWKNICNEIKYDFSPDKWNAIIESSI